MFGVLDFSSSRRSKTAQEAPKTVPRWPKRPRRAPQDGPRGPKDGPRGAQYGPRGSKHGPKRRPRRETRTENQRFPLQAAPRSPQVALRGAKKPNKYCTKVATYICAPLDTHIFDGCGNNARTTFGKSSTWYKQLLITAIMTQLSSNE